MTRRGRLLSLCLGLGLGLGLAMPGHADDRARLAAGIEGAGRNVTTMKRHAVTVSGCTMITRFEFRHPAKGWVLWSRFVFFMPDATPRARSVQTGGIVAFAMRPGTTSWYERSALRRHITGSTPSKRDDGTTHRLSHVKKFYIQHDGPGTDEKAHRFANTYTDYVRRYCAVIG